MSGSKCRRSRSCRLVVRRMAWRPARPLPVRSHPPEALSRMTRCPRDDPRGTAACGCYRTRGPRSRRECRPPRLRGPAGRPSRRMPRSGPARTRRIGRPHRTTGEHTGARRWMGAMRWQRRREPCRPISRRCDLRGIRPSRRRHTRHERTAVHSAARRSGVARPRLCATLLRSTGTARSRRAPDSSRSHRGTWLCTRRSGRCRSSSTRTGQPVRRNR